MFYYPFNLPFAKSLFYLVTFREKAIFTRFRLLCEIQEGTIFCLCKFNTKIEKREMFTIWIKAFGFGQKKRLIDKGTNQGELSLFFWKNLAIISEQKFLFACKVLGEKMGNFGILLLK